MKKILTVHVHCTDSYLIASPLRTINQILFDGTAEGELFNGEILPGGVDTQTYGVENGCLSARYTLKGTDYTGRECLMFIENNQPSGAPKTTPCITTNSEALSYLNSAALSGTLQVLADEVRIEIFEEDRE